VWFVFFCKAISGWFCVLFRFFCDPEVTAVDSWAASGVFVWLLGIWTNVFRLDYACLELLKVRLLILTVGSRVSMVSNEFTSVVMGFE